MKAIRITTEFRNDDGDKTVMVTVREGDSGTNPVTQVIYDAHFLDDALRHASREIRKARKRI